MLLAAGGEATEAGGAIDPRATPPIEQAPVVARAPSAPRPRPAPEAARPAATSPPRAAAAVQAASVAPAAQAVAVVSPGEGSVRHTHREIVRPAAREDAGRDPGMLRQRVIAGLLIAVVIGTAAYTWSALSTSGGGDAEPVVEAETNPAGGGDTSTF
jgi:hypothetical protein